MKPSNTTADLPPSAPSSAFREGRNEYVFIRHTSSANPLTDFTAPTLSILLDTL